MAHLTNENWRPTTICSANKAADFEHKVFVLPQHPRYQALADSVSVTGDSETWRGRYPLSSALNAFFRLKVSLPSGETSYAPPHGGMTIVVPAGQTRSVALPLWHERAGVGTMLGRIGGVGTVALRMTFDNLSLSIPEPSTYALLVGLATLGLVVCHRVRKGQAV